MKLFKFTLSTLVSLFLLTAQSAYAVWGVDDVDDDKTEKTQTYGAEVEISEFVLLDAMDNIELYYYPYSATDSDVVNSEDVPGGAGSVFVGGGIIHWHTNIETTISIDDFTLTHIDTTLTERNDIEAAGVGIWINGATSEGGVYSTLTFDDSHGSTVADMSSDMQVAYSILENDGSSRDMGSPSGYTDFAAKFYIAVELADAGNVQEAGIYRAIATVRALPTVSS